MAIAKEGQNLSCPTSYTGVYRRLCFLTSKHWLWLAQKGICSFFLQLFLQCIFHQPENSVIILSILLFYCTFQWCEFRFTCLHAFWKKMSLCFPSFWFWWKSCTMDFKSSLKLLAELTDWKTRGRGTVRSIRNWRQWQGEMSR